MLNVGFSNYVSSGRIVAIVSPDAAPIKRLIADAKVGGIAVDTTCGKKTAAVILVDSGHVILSALSPEELKGRLSEKETEGSK